MPAPRTIAQIGMKVLADEKQLVDQYLAHRNVERAAQHKPKEYPQDHLRPGWRKLVVAAEQWKKTQPQA